MAMPPPHPTPVQPQMTYVDRSEISETYADLLGRLSTDGITARLEFLVNRMDDAQPGAVPTGKAVTACRVIMPLAGMLDMAAKLQAIIGQLQAHGTLRQVHVPEGPQRPN